MRQQTDPRFPVDLSLLVRRLTDVWRELAQQVNGVTEGSIASFHAARVSAPAVGKYAVGDFVRNSTPSELGTAGSKYIVHGWTCTVAGEPGTWVESRFLTGN
jgi:hypothetical protein